MPRKIVSEADAFINRHLPDLTSKVSYRVCGVVKDGTKLNVPSAFLVLVKLPDNVNSGKSDVQCLLKVFPEDSRGTVRYKTERAVNAQLNEHAKSLGLIRNDPKQKDSEKRTVPWPLCYGRLRVEDDISLVSQRFSFSGRRALLFEYIEGLRLLQKSDLTEKLCANIIRYVELVHGARVVHRDLKEHGAEPDVGFRNIFVVERVNRAPKRRRVENQVADVVILDFDHAKVVPPIEEGDAENVNEVGLSARERKRRERLAAAREEERRLPHLEVEGLRELFRRSGVLEP